MCPFHDAKCSGVYLQNKYTAAAMPAIIRSPDLSPGSTVERLPRQLARSPPTVPVAVIALHVRARRQNCPHGGRVAIAAFLGDFPDLRVFFQILPRRPTVE